MKSTIAVMSPGDMGHGRRRVAPGRPAGDQPAGRSQPAHTRSPTGLASRKLRMTPPWCAQRRSCWRSWCRRKDALAERIARAIAASGARPVYVDCNAIAPQTTRQIAEIIDGAGARFVDAGNHRAAAQARRPQPSGSMPQGRCRGVRPARRLRAGCACGRRSAGSGVRAQDVLRRPDQGHDGAHDAALGVRRGSASARP